MAFALTIATTHTKTLIAPSSGSEDKVYGVDYVSSTSHTSSVTAVTGELAVANGGTGLASGTSGGVLYFSASGTLASSAALAANSLVIGGGAGTAPFTSANLTFGPTAGQGLFVGAGTATTDVNALSLTQTWNNAAVRFSALKVLVTDTAKNTDSHLLDLGTTANGRVFAVTSKGGAPEIWSDSGSLQFNIQGISGRRPVMLSYEGHVKTASGGMHSWSASTTDANSADTSVSRGVAGQVLIGTGSAGSFAGGLKLTTLTMDGLAITKGYTVATLPAGVTGGIVHVTDQLTTVAAKGVAPTGGGAVVCAVIYNGAAWVGI